MFNLKSLYADKCNGKIPGLMDDCTKDQRSLEHKLAAIADQLREITDLRASSQTG
ncbi:MAG: hypothetical protein ACOYIR_02705 [Christensenellales bacterium]